MTARSEIDETVLDEALAWHRALAGDDADWDAYTLWLEADPRHRQAFDEIALTERIVDDRIGDLRYLGAVPPPAAVPMRSRRNWFYGAGAVAAGLALALAIPVFQARHADVIYSTGRGEIRQIALGQGMAVALAPASRLVEQGGDATRLELVQGDAYFTVSHDPARTLSIKAGEYAVTDIGTTFGVNLSAEAVTVSVAEGNVSLIPDGGATTRVSAGQQLTASRSGGAAQLATMSAKDVGSWRQGRLVYNNAPLAVVAADISRYSGKTVTIDPALDGKTFSGILAIGDGSGLLADLAGLAAISYEEKGDSVRLGAAAGR